MSGRNGSSLYFMFRQNHEKWWNFVIQVIWVSTKYKVNSNFFFYKCSLWRRRRRRNSWISRCHSHSGSKNKNPKVSPSKSFLAYTPPPPKPYTHVKSLHCLWKAKKIYIFSLWAAHGHGKNHAIAWRKISAVIW
jgi:hypothetical protein